MKNNSKKPTAARQPSPASKPAAKKAPVKPVKKDSMLLGLTPYILGLVAVFFAACLLFTDFTGALGRLVNDWLKGWFSLGAYGVPVVMFVRALCFRKDHQKGGMLLKWIFSLLCVMLIATFYSIFFETPQEYDYLKFYKKGMEMAGGGALCGGFAMLMMGAIGKVATGMVSVVLTVGLGAFIFGRSPVEVLDGIAGWFSAKLSDWRDDAKDRRLARKEEKERYRQLEVEELPHQKPAKTYRRTQPKQTRDWPLEEDEPQPEPQPQAEPQADDCQDLPGFDDQQGVLERKRSAPAPTREQAPYDPDQRDILTDPVPPAAQTLQDVFSEKQDPELSRRFGLASELSDELADEAELTLTPDTLSTPAPAVEEKPAAPAEPPYRFPPLSLLRYEPVKQLGDHREQERTADKLVEVLHSFGVKARMLNVAVGPTVTRYELQPDVGVRVRSIVNLADDIALKLAASGVRIEAPIPGKEAVGIEVPNKSVATVYLRELLENEAFREAEGRLTTCLGMDVAGQPIYCNLTKMPHLLIAGATNMGKSVCMNSIISSILYKATPDEVKMILIDPKKVEMSIYNGIPHLIVPVVSEPKKAAGALAWAVSEMERRFALIEELGVRNIQSYNKAVASDPERSKEPFIVVIIDELADLMMTAKNEVETSICRLAQKARAAGIHLIIGTQRPSVDVITGLIKANFPSRIAFTVASQVDSKTVLDYAGAEKLMGRGDMLYAPVGSTKPTRVQGSFVSEAEVEAITDFLRDQSHAQYSQEIQEQIEREAARCGEKKHGGFDADPDNMGGETGENDPVLPQAIKIAIEAGKISTSFIQRKLQLGYARAGRITDRMGNMGVIGPFNGSKPREVLWTMNDYMEWMQNQQDTPL